MLHWIIATAEGISLGLVLYGCVRIRMHFGPILNRRYGTWARATCWIVVVLLMILLANVALMGLRAYAGIERTGTDMLILEIWFAVLALAVALKLIFTRMNRAR